MAPRYESPLTDRKKFDVRRQRRTPAEHAADQSLTDRLLRIADRGTTSGLTAVS